jgi:ferritin-like protein
VKFTKYNKITFMDASEEDAYEIFQASTARPYATKRTPEIAGWYLKGYHTLPGRNHPLTKVQRLELKQFCEKIQNRVKSNRLFTLGVDDIEWCKELVNDFNLSKSNTKLIAMVLGKSTNQGLKEFDELVDMTGITGSSKATESFAKKILVEEYNVPNDQFELQDSTGNGRLIYDPEKNEIRYDSDKSIFRSIDAIMVLDFCVVVFCMKYKGGTAAVSGSGQSDQSTEFSHVAKHVEDHAKKGNFLTYQNKPVFYANLVYGKQFLGAMGTKRIYENELSLRQQAGKNIVQSFNVSLSKVNEVANAINTEIKNGTELTSVLKNVYNIHGLNIEVRGKNKDELAKYI